MPTNEPSDAIVDADLNKRASDDQDHCLSQEEALEESLEDSMDGSDAPSITQPGDHGDPVPSSGFPDDTKD
ncbi:MAG: hypothetical protein ACSLE1_12565 [Sphingobium sp.]